MHGDARSSYQALEVSVAAEQEYRAAWERFVSVLNRQKVGILNLDSEFRIKVRNLREKVPLIARILGVK